MKTVFLSNTLFKVVIIIIILKGDSKSNKIFVDCSPI